MLEHRSVTYEVATEVVDEEIAAAGEQEARPKTSATWVAQGITSPFIMEWFMLEWGDEAFEYPLMEKGIKAVHGKWAKEC